MTLESRAVHASRALRASVAGVGRPAGVTVVLRRRRWERIGFVSAAAMLAALTAAIVFALPMTDETATETSVPTTIPATTTTLPPDQPQPAVIDSDEQDEGADPTTTSIPPGPATTVPASGATTPPDGARPATATSTTAGAPATPTPAPAEPSTTTTTAAATSTTTSTTTTTSAPTPTTKPEPGDGWEFTAHQQSGGSGTGLSDLFWGTAAPGDQIVIWSPNYDHISAAATVDESGEWELAVDYGDVTPNQEFHVKVDDTTTGQRLYFTYTWISDEPGDGGTSVLRRHLVG